MRTHEAHGTAEAGRLLSIDDVADVLNVSRKTVYRLTARGDLVASRVGERLRYRPADITAYIDRRRVPLGEAP